MKPVAISLDPVTWSDPQMRQAWNGLVRAGPHALYASPVWFDHLRRVHGDGGLALVICRGENAEIRGVAPLRVATTRLDYQVGARSLASVRCRAAFVLGSEPALPAASFRDLCREVFQTWPDCDCIYLESLPQQSEIWPRLRDAPGLLHVPDGMRPWHLIDLGQSAERYFAGMSAKLRKTLKYEQRRLERDIGALGLLRADSAAQVQQFVEQAVAVSKASWQHRVLGPRITAGDIARFTDLAQCGILRSYLLTAGERPCAFVVGYQYAGVYYYNEVAYDPALRPYSPGTVLLYLIIGDLFASNPPALLDFGLGHADYKARFGNLQMADATVFVFRPTFRSRLLRSTHRAFRTLVRAGRRMVKGQRTLPVSPD